MKGRKQNNSVSWQKNMWCKVWFITKVTKETLQALDISSPHYYWLIRGAFNAGTNYEERLGLISHRLEHPNTPTVVLHDESNNERQRNLFCPLHNNLRCYEDKKQTANGVVIMHQDRKLTPPSTPSFSFFSSLSLYPDTRWPHRSLRFHTVLDALHPDTCCNATLPAFQHVASHAERSATRTQSHKWFPNMCSAGLLINAVARSKAQLWAGMALKGLTRTGNQQAPT